MQDFIWNWTESDTYLSHRLWLQIKILKIQLKISTYAYSVIHKPINKWPESMNYYFLLLLFFLDIYDNRVYFDILYSFCCPN